jgi:uracil-DNA glycosylase|tara:strand:- start:347 stop:532 length:186 start_codon:yes stop_codon:yes gene_type:complete
MQDNIQKINECNNIFQEEIEKFNEKGVGAAGTRARKALLDIAKLTKEIRKQIQEKKNEGKA